MAQGFPTNSPAQNSYTVTTLIKETKVADFTAASGYSYSADHATPATLLNATLPTSAADGDEIEFVTGDNTGGLKIKVDGTHLKPIRINSAVSLSTSSGFWSSIGPNAVLRLRYYAGEQAWIATSVVGSWLNDAGLGRMAGGNAYLDANGRLIVPSTSSGGLLLGFSSAQTNGLLQVNGSIGVGTSSGTAYIRNTSNTDGGGLVGYFTQLVAATTNSNSYSYSGGALLAALTNADARVFEAGAILDTDARLRASMYGSGKGIILYVSNRDNAGIGITGVTDGVNYATNLVINGQGGSHLYLTAGNSGGQRNQIHFHNSGDGDTFLLGCDPGDSRFFLKVPGAVKNAFAVSKTTAQMAQYLTGTSAPVSGDFDGIGNSSVIFSRASDTSFRVSMMGNDGTVRSGLMPVSTAGNSSSVYGQAEANGGKTFEWGLYSATDKHLIGGSSGAGNGTLLGPLKPSVIPGRTDDANGTYLPTGTTVSTAFALVSRTNGMGASFAPAYRVRDNADTLNIEMTYFGNTHATKPNNIEITSIRDSDGGTDTDTLADWVLGTTDYWELIHTIQANSATANARIYDLVVKRNGTTVLTKTNRRYPSLNIGINQGGLQGQYIGTTNVSMLGNAAVKVVYP